MITYGDAFHAPPFGSIVVASFTENPQWLVQQAMRKCHGYAMKPFVNEQASGEAVVKHLLSGNRGHFGCFEHPAITLECIGWPHSIMQQLRTHRVGVSFDVESFRQSQGRILDLVESIKADESLSIDRQLQLKKLFYLPSLPNTYVGFQEMRLAQVACVLYADKIAEGMTPDEARTTLPFDYRQSWMLSLNARSLMHMLDLRAKADASKGAQAFAGLLFKIFREWMPEVAEWYEEKRLSKAILSP